jgi:hypothetical protein
MYGVFRDFFFDRVETIDGSAVEGEDYEPLNEILTFEPHEREKEVNLKDLYNNHRRVYDSIYVIEIL